MSGKLLSVLCYSAGVQSHAILRMVLDGTIEKPSRFSVIAADPGMESFVSGNFINQAKADCEASGIPFIVAEGPNLFRDVIDLPKTSRTRLDTPPLWTKKPSGARGSLLQKCTKFYKIRPIDRVVRKELLRIWGLKVNSKSGLSPGCVERWIGFTKDEQERADRLISSPNNKKFVSFRFPLIEMGLTKSDVYDIYFKKDWPIPVRSMCCGCPFHGLRSLKDMHDNRPLDWDKAVAFDDAARNLKQVGVNNECFVSKTLIPLRQLASMGFELDDPIENDFAQCSSGVCFV